MDHEEIVTTEAQKTIAAQIKSAALAEAPRELSAEYYKLQLEKARRVSSDLYVAFWYGPEYKTRYLVVFRLDRKPVPDEYLPWLQLLFESRFAHSGSTDYSMEFIEGDVYVEESESMADKMANAVVDYAEEKGDVR